jgi:hypothetical protein
MEPGKSLLAVALRKLGKHEAWRELVAQDRGAA